MTRRIRSTILVMLLGLYSTATAQEANPTGFAFSLGFGPSTIEDVDGPGDEFDGGDIGWNFDVEWRFIEYVALGMNIATFGEDTDFFNGTDTTIEINGIGLYARGYLPVNDRLLLHATWGSFSYDADVDPNQNFSLLLFDGSADAYGLGADYRLSKNWSARFDHRWYDGQRREAGTLTTLGFRFQF